jgi:hypothetical protein
MSRRQLDAIAVRASRDLLKVMRADLKAALPTGWRGVLAVGWGVTVFDHDGKMVDEYKPKDRGGGMSKHPMSAKLKRVVAMCDEFGDRFGLDNSEVRGK